MVTKDFTISKLVKTSPAEAFTAIAARIPDWWSRQFEGTAVETGQIFTVSFDSRNDTFKKIRTGKLVQNKLVEWECIDAFINKDFLSNKKEWIGTKMIWNLEDATEGTKISFTHEGLTPDFECYEICNKGWNQFFTSLVKLLETGAGEPYRAS